MFITKKHLSRRTFLKGAGAVVALPFLDAMVPAVMGQSGQAPIQRFAWVYTPNGILMKQFMPDTVGTGIDFKPALKSMEPHREYINVVSGLYNVGVQNHPPSPPMWLSGNVPGAGGDQLDTRLRLATTVDQAIARKIGKDSIFESLQVATEDASQLIGTCAIDDNCAYMNTISWRTPTQPLTMESEPRTIFERLFGGADATPEARARRLRDNTSILDTITADIRELGGELGSSDRARVDQYMDNVRTVERQLVRGEEQRQSRNLEAPEVPVDVLGFEQQIDMMFELQALAFQGDLTRVTSYMLARELSGQTYPEFGVPDPHHPVSHHGYVPERMEMKARIDAYHMSLFEKFVNKLKSTPEGDGNLLDSIVIMYGAGMSNSMVHDHMNMPVLLVGGGAGKLRGDRHIQMGRMAAEENIPGIPFFDEMVPISNLHVAMQSLAGVEVDSFGAAENQSTDVVVPL